MINLLQSIIAELQRRHTQGQGQKQAQPSFQLPGYSLPNNNSQQSYVPRSTEGRPIVNTPMFQLPGHPMPNGYQQQPQQPSYNAQGGANGKNYLNQNRYDQQRVGTQQTAQPRSYYGQSSNPGATSVNAASRMNTNGYRSLQKTGRY